MHCAAVNHRLSARSSRRSPGSRSAGRPGRRRTHKSTRIKYTRDVLGNLTQVTSGATGNKFTYDGLNRLTNVTDLGTTQVAAYSYDATGNRLTKQAGTGSPIVPYTYLNNTHQLLAVDTTVRGYDAMGNTTAIGTGTSAKAFVYDNTGRMSQLNNGSGTAQMQYLTNAGGERVEKYLTGNTALTQFTSYDESGHALGDYDSAANRIRETVWMDGLPVGVISGATSPTVSYIEPDHLGTPRAAIDATSGASVWNWGLVNDPFGETQPTGTLNLNLRMPGQGYDSESGLNYNFFRDYDAGTGRYVESDPIGLLGGISTYGYVGGSPLSNLDPTGLMCVASGATVKCWNPGWPTVSFPRPPGWPESISDDEESYHRYDVPVNIGCADPNSVASGITDSPTPGNPSPATPGGTPNDATPQEYSGIPGLSPNPVISYLTSDQAGNQYVINVTQPGHSLFPGYVVRTVSNGIVHNYGEGDAWKQSGWSPIASKIDSVWLQQSQDIIKGSRRKCGCK